MSSGPLSLKFAVRTIVVWWQITLLCSAFGFVYIYFLNSVDLLSAMKGAVIGGLILAYGFWLIFYFIMILRYKYNTSYRKYFDGLSDTKKVKEIYRQWIFEIDF